MSDKKVIKTVAGVIVNDKGEVLCSLRDQGKYDYVSFKWEFPGGKMEQGENEHQTLVRELREELEIEVEVGEHFYTVEHDYPDFHLTMSVYKCHLLSKEMKMNVHKALKWLHPREMADLDWAAADIPVAKKVIETMN